MEKQKQSKKIIINEIHEQSPKPDEAQIEVKKSKRLQGIKDHQADVENNVEEFYQDKKFDHLDKPAIIGVNKIWAVIIAIIFGLISGTVATLFILTRPHLDLPWTNIDLAQYFPIRETTTVTEKKVTVTNDLRLATLTKDLNNNTFSIFQAKKILEQGDLPFLEQIYAPWQIVSSAVVVKNDGWLISGPVLSEQDITYVAIDNENNIFAVQEIITDSVTGITFLKISAQDLKPVSFAALNEITSGRQVLIIDKFKNIHVTEINKPDARIINKTQDLVYSTDKFSDFLRLDNETSISAMPYAFIFGLDGKLIGIVAKGTSIPLWRFGNKIDNILQNKKFSRPYLGIDYIRIEQASGLMSSLFKDLTNGAIVYGSPAEQSPALKAGITNADVIVKVDDVVLNKDIDLTYLIQQKKPGDTVALSILRKGEEMVIQVELVGRE